MSNRASIQDSRAYLEFSEQSTPELLQLKPPLTSYLRTHQHGGIEALKVVGCYRPQSALHAHSATLAGYFRHHPPATAKEAMAQFDNFKQAITTCLEQTQTTYKAELDTLLKPRFQTFKKSQIMTR